MEISIKDFSDFYQEISENVLCDWLETLPSQIKKISKLYESKKTRFYKSIVDNIPSIVPDKIDIKKSIVIEGEISSYKRKTIYNLLKKLSPWKKGPFHIYGIHIDGEWRSDLKWKKIFSKISVKGKLVLDVGCNNGYYMWRILGEGAKIVVGIDPNQLCFFQFKAIKKLIGNNKKIYLIPLKLKKMQKLGKFDVVFSMGLIYHLRSPLDHILQLKDQLNAGGRLIIETLTTKSDRQQCIFPKDRYAGMKNVYFIPSIKMLKTWLKRFGFVNVKVLSKNILTSMEQRRTKWAKYDSLSENLNRSNKKLTIEGYNAPIRAIIVSEKK
ncbi:hypothetical protein AOE58_01165 [Candidatus Riesia pthiripubis]|uniref:tRNA U34 carboxymethyltransferase n=1 Tax=Candidatus Riesia pthiripubis TaxID=428412 RepID=A0A1V0HP88_9ENTR|nr:hypothetical protein AOE58_01165 [Candidatus Riesia pthiripubis]